MMRYLYLLDVGTYQPYFTFCYFRLGQVGVHGGGGDGHFCSTWFSSLVLGVDGVVRGPHEGAGGAWTGGAGAVHGVLLFEFGRRVYTTCFLDCIMVRWQQGR